LTGGYLSLTNQTIEDIDYTGITAGFNLNGNTAVEATYSEDTMDIDNQNIELISLDYVSHFDLTSRIKLETKVGYARATYDVNEIKLYQENYFHAGMGLSANFENGITVKMMNENYIREGNNSNGTSVSMQYRF